MITKGTQSKAKALAVCSEILKRANLEAKIKTEMSGDFTVLRIDIDFKRPLKEIASFVGGLEYILRLILLQQDSEPKILIDVNNYREKRQEEIAEMVAEKMASMGNGEDSVALPPMNAYDRRLVHQIVSKSESLMSESFGTGRQRRIIIKKREELG